uniref:T4 RNA ligase 1-like N-terminal domain-containing protein n=1 Tax=viral metagenome TaxID=1070528 RepID=A0A6C0DDB6_9ZZZZ
MNTNKTFATLIARFPTTETLFAYLRSAEGGRLTIRQSKEIPLSMIYYDKTVSVMSLPHVGMFRSIVWDERSNRPCCVSPAKGRDILGDNPPALGLVVEDFMDGTMINQFWDGTTWRLATRTLLDATSAYYGTYRDSLSVSVPGPVPGDAQEAGEAAKPFATLFTETLQSQLGLTMAQFDPRFCYSWVLNHPAERVVVPAKYGLPSLSLVEVYHIDPATTDVSHRTGREFVSHLPSDTANQSALKKALEKTLPPAHTDITLVGDIKARTQIWGKRFRHEWQGLVGRCPLTGTRYRIRSAEYEFARNLRGNQSNLRYQWLELWTKGTLQTYLTIYPEEAVEAEEAVAAFKKATEEIYNLYQVIYKRREMPLGQAPHKYRKLLWDIHSARSGAYFPALRSFMNLQDTARKLWLINYERRYGASAAAPAPEAVAAEVAEAVAAPEAIA